MVNFTTIRMQLGEQQIRVQYEVWKLVQSGPKIIIKIWSTVRVDRMAIRVVVQFISKPAYIVLVPHITITGRRIQRYCGSYRYYWMAVLCVWLRNRGQMYKDLSHIVLGGAPPAPLVRWLGFQWVTAVGLGIF